MWFLVNSFIKWLIWANSFMKWSKMVQNGPIWVQNGPKRSNMGPKLGLYWFIEGNRVWKGLKSRFWGSLYVFWRFLTFSLDYPGCIFHFFSGGVSKMVQNGPIWVLNWAKLVYNGLNWVYIGLNWAKLG